MFIFLFLLSNGDLCKVWDRRTLNEASPKPVGVLAGHMDGITYIDSKGDSRYLITNSKDQSIKLWDVRVFSSSEAQANTRRVVSEQNWDYRWQKAPRKRKSSTTLSHPTFWVIIIYEIKYPLSLRRSQSPPIRETEGHSVTVSTASVPRLTIKRMAHITARPKDSCSSELKAKLQKAV